MTTPIKEELRNSGLSARKRLGQHFLKSERIAARIADACRCPKGGTIVEIGPGLGILTAPLLRHGRPVVAVEKDRALAARLATQENRTTALRIVEADILACRLPDLCPAPRVVMGNIPYQITAPILFWLLDQHDQLEEAVLMVQREVARRITAEAGDKTYGILSVLLQRWAKPQRLFDVPPEAFHPKPKVVSTIIRLEFLKRPRVDFASEIVWRTVVKAAFSHRRKTLANSLGAWARAQKMNVDVRSWLRAAKIPPSVRPETLSLEQFRRLADASPLDIPEE